VQTSNSYFFESERDWSGICIECDPAPFSILNGFRKSKNFQIAVSDYNGTCRFSNMSISENGIELPCRKLNEILEEADAPNFIDYLSIDIEGHEFTVLNSTDLKKWKFGVMTVEHNLYCMGPENKNKIYDLLSSNGYIRVVEDAVSLDTNPAWHMKPYEDWYVNQSIINELDL
jgi:FkbM family methyltransferase